MITTNVLEANVVRHCNNRCAACNHGSAFAEPYLMSPAVLKRDLETLLPILHTEFFCLQGGEPLLHPEIVELMDVAYSSGIGNKYGLLTNGRLLDLMPNSFWEMAGKMRLELRCSVYPNLPADIIPSATIKAIKNGVDFRPGEIGAFLKILEDNPECKNFSNCLWRKCHTVHEGYFFICPLSAFFPKLFKNMPEHIDGYSLINCQEEELKAFINREEPPETCKICAGTNGKRFAWSQVSTLDEWIESSKNDLPRIAE